MGRERPSKPNDSAVTLYIVNPDGGVRNRMFTNVEDIEVHQHGIIVDVGSTSAVFIPMHRIDSIEGTAVAVRRVINGKEQSP